MLKTYEIDCGGSCVTVRAQAHREENDKLNFYIGDDLVVSFEEWQGFYEV